MRLDSVEIVGFKSFCDRQELSFKGGVTGIVGPNGCGKSNISDAIKSGAEAFMRRQNKTIILLMLAVSVILFLGYGVYIAFLAWRQGLIAF